MRYLGKRGDTGGKAGRALARLGTRTWNTDPALSLFRTGLDLLNNRIGSIARWIHRIACKVERRVEMKTRLVIVSLRHMAHQAQDFALLVDDDRFAFLGPKIKPPTLATGKRIRTQHWPAAKRLLRTCNGAQEMKQTRL